MNNFKKHGKKHPRSVDGFVPAARSGYRPGDLSSFNQYYKPDKAEVPQTEARPVDDFSRSVDGFTPAARPAIPVMRAARSHDGYAPAFAADKLPEVKIQAPKPKKEKKRFLRKSGKKRSRRRTLMRMGAVAGVFILLVGGGLMLRGYLASRGIFKGGGNSAFLNNGDIDPSQLNGEGDGRVNILLLGKGGAEQRDGPDLTDTIIIASIDPLAKEAALLSIPRDLWVKNSVGGQVKINQIYYDGKQAALNKYPYAERNSDNAKEAAETAGLSAIKKSVSDNMGVPIHYHVIIDFAGFRKAVDTVGGVDINVTEDMAVSERMRLVGYGTYNLNVKPGQQHFDGWKALAFSRSRKTSAGRGDYKRADRQRAVILALKDKILSAGTLANPVKLNQLMSDFSGSVSTDFSINELLRLYDISKEITADKVVSAGLDDLLTDDSALVGGRSLSIQVPKAGWNDFSEIQSYVRNIMRDAFIRRENAKVVILNGTGSAGVATRRANELKSFGYNIVSVGDAPTDDYSKTVLVNLRGDDKKYTVNYLQKRFGATATRSLPDSSIQPGEADIVIILGTDAR